MAEGKRRVSFLVFFMMWARLQGWDVPDLHVRMCVWLEHCAARVRVLLVFRGAAKSTIYACYKAWLLYCDPTLRSLVWGADGPVAVKLSRDVINVLSRHPLCKGMLPMRRPAKEFWVNGATDHRNASIVAKGVDSNVTSARADRVDYDDIEVPKNIRTPDARLSLRQKIEEATHIGTPGFQKTFIGTPHTHLTIYDEQIDGGADVLKIPLFEHAVRYESTDSTRRYAVPFDTTDLYVFLGIHKGARLLKEGEDYQLEGQFVVFDQAPGMTPLDIYGGCAWPERFDRAELLLKRKETRTINAWDSQYMLEARPVGETRLDPDRMPVYAVEPHIEMRNRVPVLMLGRARIVGFSAWWDVSLGKVHSDDSALCCVFSDALGNLYWHRAIGLTGNLDELDSRGNLVGGQVRQLIDALSAIYMHHVRIEVNGPGGFVPAIARRHCKPVNIGVTEHISSGNKQARILDAIEAPLSSGFLYCHTSVVESPAFEQMRQWKADTSNQPDDYLDALAGCITETPIRLDRIRAEKATDQSQSVKALRPGGDGRVEMEF